MNFPEGGIRMGYNANGGWDYMFNIAAIENWCDNCVHAETGSVDSLVISERVANYVAGMGPFDWIALGFASVIVAFQVVGELKDIELCMIAVNRAEKLGAVYHVGIWFIQFVRRWVFLSALTVGAPVLVCFRGGDALSVCFNTIAILFMVRARTAIAAALPAAAASEPAPLCRQCEIDNLCYHFGLAERRRARVEDAGRVELSHEEAAAMARTKEVHVVIVVVTILAAVKISGGAWAASECGTEDTRPCSEDDPVQRDPGGQMAGGFVLVVVGYFVGGLYEAFEPGLSHRHAIGP